MKDRDTIDRQQLRSLVGRYVSSLWSGVGWVVQGFNRRDRLTQAAVIYLVIFTAVGVFGPSLATHDFSEQHFAEDGGLKTLESPSSEHLMGTTNRGEDVFSRLVVGARPTLLTGLLGGSMIVGIGLFMGLTSGYVGGVVDGILMRFTDFVYGVPVLPTAIVLAAFFGSGLISSVVVIGLVLWRGSARVLRSQVLQIKERPFIRILQASGASSFRIATKHLLPNILPMAILFFAFGLGDAIIIQAGLSFVGVSDPFLPAYGTMVRNAYNSGALARAWWWSIPPGLLIGLTVLSAYLVGRSFEETESDRVIGQ